MNTTNLESTKVVLTASDFYNLEKALEFQFNALTSKKGEYRDSNIILGICETLPKIMEASKIAFNHDDLKSGSKDLELFMEAKK